MGACDFQSRAQGGTAEEAFRRAVSSAAYDHGHSGYTGTIAEKGSFTIIAEAKPANAEEAYAIANRLISAGDDRVDDKWGPAGCIVIRPADALKPIGKAKALSLAKKKYGETAEVEVRVVQRASKNQKRVVTATVTVVSDKTMPGGNVQLPNGKWRSTVKTAEGGDEKEACGKLFAEAGDFLFFGWASS